MDESAPVLRIAAMLDLHLAEHLDTVSVIVVKKVSCLFLLSHVSVFFLLIILPFFFFLLTLLLLFFSSILHHSILELLHSYKIGIYLVDVSLIQIQLQL